MDIKEGTSGQAIAIKIGGNDRERLIKAISETAAPLRDKAFETFYILRYR